MATPFTEQLDAYAYRCIDSELTLALCEVLTPTLFQSFGGKLTGPNCRFAKTLPSTTQIPASEVLQSDASTFTQAQVIDPCYWTPGLPFLYTLTSDITYADGTTTSATHTLGLRRWEVEGQNLLLERKRTVLRGVVCSNESEIDLEVAHDAELAVMVNDPSEAFLQEASEGGVLVVADIRASEQDLTGKLLSYTWQPAVGLVLPKMDASYVPRSQILAAVVQPNDSQSLSASDEDWPKVIVVELQAGQRPPSELAAINKPVIAIRRGVDCSDLGTVRAACDRLQAELAPEFDLAGYFVAP